MARRVTYGTGAGLSYITCTCMTKHTCTHTMILFASGALGPGTRARRRCRWATLRCRRCPATRGAAGKRENDLRNGSCQIGSSRKGSERGKLEERWRRPKAASGLYQPGKPPFQYSTILTNCLLSPRIHAVPGCASLSVPHARLQITSILEFSGGDLNLGDPDPRFPMRSRHLPTDVLMPAAALAAILTKGP